MISDAIRHKISNLLDRAPELAKVTDIDFLLDSALNQTHTSSCQAWIAETRHITELAVPIPKNAYRQQMEKIANVRNGAYSAAVEAMAAILRSLVTDIDAGLLISFRNSVITETFDNFLDHANAYYKARKHQESGVIAGVVFEDTIRRICRDKEVAEKGMKLEDLINTLTKQSVITAQQSKQAKVASHVRTKSTHA